LDALLGLFYQADYIRKQSLIGFFVDCAAFVFLMHFHQFRPPAQFRWPENEQTKSAELAKRKKTRLLRTLATNDMIYAYV
jgi:hypothetical protein